MLIKFCPKCNLNKNIHEFENRKDSKDGKRSICKLCMDKTRRNHYVKNRQYKLKYQKQWRENHPNYNKEYSKKWNMDHREEQLPKMKEYHKKWYIKNKEKRYKQIYKNRKKRLRNDPVFKLRCRISSSISETLRNLKCAKNISCWKALPYNPSDLRYHLEKLWEPWMSWENYGRASSNMRTWNIDHIIPQSKLPYDSLDHPNFLQCWSLKNLRPLEAIFNIQKGNRLNIT